MQVLSTLELAKKSILLTGTNMEVPATYGGDLEKEVNAGAEAFETMYDITLYETKNEIEFYPWDETECWLPIGATSVTIRDAFAKEVVFLWEDIPKGKDVSGDDVEELIQFLEDNFSLDGLELAIVSKDGDEITVAYEDGLVSITLEANSAILDINGDKTYEFDVSLDSGRHKILASCLRAGDVLVLEEIESPSKDSPVDQTHRHAVRLTSIATATDDLTGAKVMEIGWGLDDALPFALCLARDGRPLSIARGNIVLADHGYTRTEELELATVGGRYYPALGRKPLTRRGPEYDTDQGSDASSATSAFSYEQYDVVPAVELSRVGEIWKPQRDLLSSVEFSKEFVVEAELDGTTYVRFPNDERKGWAEDIESGDFDPFTVTYRIGTGERGNVGPYSIGRLFSTTTGIYGNVKKVFNPMVAKGGKEPETLSSIRLHAPQAFRKAGAASSN